MFSGPAPGTADLARVAAAVTAAAAAVPAPGEFRFSVTSAARARCVRLQPLHFSPLFFIRFLQSCFSLPQSIPQQEEQGEGQRRGGQQWCGQDEGAQSKSQPQEQEEQERGQERHEGRLQVQVSFWFQVSLQIRNQRSLQEIWLKGPRAAQERRGGRRA